MSGRSNGVGSFERINDRILDEGRVGDGDPLEIQKLKFVRARADSYTDDDV